MEQRRNREDEKRKKQRGTERQRVKEEWKDVVKLCIMLYNEKGRDTLIYKVKGEKYK